MNLLKREKLRKKEDFFCLMIWFVFFVIFMFFVIASGVTMVSFYFFQE